QFGTGVRTWWSLNFTQPGTRFILQVVSACRSAGVTQIDPTTGKVIVISPGGEVRIHQGTWTWRGGGGVDTLGSVIGLMHGGAVSTLEVPCIIGEDMYDALKKAQGRLAGAISGGDLTSIGNAVFDMEALIVSNCLFTEILNPLTFFPGPDQFKAPNIQPP